MKLHEITSTPGSTHRRKRVGRGDGSGMGKTACHGEKGQHSRTGSSYRPFFEGGQITFFRRLPKRGFKSMSHVDYTLVNLDIIEANFDAGETVNSETLRAKSLIGKAELPLKILANGELTKAVTVQAVKFSAAAAAKIEAAGGKVEVIA